MSNVDSTTLELKPTIKLNYINALRGLAILGVILVHNGEYGPELPKFPAIIRTIVDQGARGVQLFFVASAFTLFLSMSKRKREKHPTRNFFIRRFFRIAPMYYLGIAFYAFWFTNVQLRHVTIASILANITFLHGISPYWINSLVPGGWSITVEMWFYCLAPLLFIKLKSVNQAVRFIASSIIVSCLLSIILGRLHITVNEWQWTSFLFLYFPSQLPVFGFGILLYLIIYNSEQIRHIQPNTFILAATASLLVLVTRMGNSEYILFGIANGGQHYWFGAAFLLLALGLSKYSPQLLVNPILTYIGEVSFSLYLIHFALLFALQYTGHSELIHIGGFSSAIINFGFRYVLIIAAGTAIATVFYRVIELPFQNLGKKLIILLEK